MALVLLDRVQETSTTTGTGTFTLLGAVSGFRSFASIGNGNQTYYTIADPGSGAWEVGIGTYTSSGTTLSRTTVFSSSNAGSLVNFAAGTKNVFVTYPSSQAIYEETNGETIFRGGPITAIGAGVTSYIANANSIGRFVANQNTFQAVDIRNSNSGVFASSDFIARNDLSGGGTYFVDLGIVSSGFSAGGAYAALTPNSSYLLNEGGELLLGSTSAHDVALFANGLNSTGEALRINATTRNVTMGKSVSVGGTLNVTGASTFGSTVLLNSDPTIALQAATKQYVDNQVTAGLHIHEPVRVETTGNLVNTYVQGGTTFNITTITSGTTVTTSTTHGLVVGDQIWLTTTAGNGLSTNTAYFVFSTPATNQLTLSLTFGGAQITGLTNAAGLTYATRANSGVGATLTNAGTQAALVIDGITMVVADRVMVRLQTNGAENGVYTVTNIGSGSTNWILTRATDSNRVDPASPTGVGTGDYYFTREGVLNAGDSHVLTTEPNTMIIGYTPLTFTQFSGGVDYVGGTNIDVTGQTISLTGTVAATNGGTGTSTVTTGDLLYGTGTNTWGKLPVGAAYKSIIVNSGGTQLEWNAVPLDQAAAVSGALGTVNGGTGLNSYTTGDLIYSSATNTLAKLAGNTLTSKRFLNQTGTGSASAAPSWGTIAASDVSGLAASATTDTTDAANITSGTLPSGRLIGGYGQVTGVGNLTSGTWSADVILPAYGGTGQSTYTDGQLLIGNSTGNTLTKATLTAGSGISITNGAGSITINSTGGGGSVTNVSVVAANGFNGTVATSTSTPAITLSTTVTGILQGNGTAISAITVGSGLSFVGGTLSASGSGVSPATPTVEGIVYGSTDNTNFFTALGYNANGTGASNVDSVAIGHGATITAQESTAVGGTAYAVYRGTSLGYSTSAGAFYSTALGHSASAGADSSIAIGYSAAANGANGTVIGRQASSGASATYSTVIGRFGATNFANTIVLTGSGGIIAPNSGVFMDSFRDESTGSPNKVLKYNTTTKELFYGTAASTSYATNTTLGTVYGFTTSAPGDTPDGPPYYSTSIGYNASAGTSGTSIGVNSSSGQNSVAIGGAAVPGTQAVGIGNAVVANTTYSTAIGGEAQITGPSAANATAIGGKAKTSYTSSIVISGSGGITAPNSGVFMDSFRDESAGAPNKILKYNTTTKELFFGAAGGGGSPATPTVEGILYGNTTYLSTNSYVTTLGYNSSALNNNAVSIGANAESDFAGVAIGINAKANATAAVSGGSVAVGASAISASRGGIAIGQNSTAGSGANNSIAIGKSSITSYPSSIVLSGTGGITAPNAGVFIDSFRDESAGSPDKVIKYNTTTKELFYGVGGGGSSPATTTSFGTVYGNTTTTNTFLGYNGVLASGKIDNVVVGNGGAYANGSVAIGINNVVYFNNGVAIGKGAQVGSSVFEPSVVISGTGGLSPTDGGFYVDTLRGAPFFSPNAVVRYNTTTKELSYDTSSSSGTVTNVSVVSANGLAGTVATSTSTPAITLSTTVTGVLKGNGTAISAATGGTDYQEPIIFTTTGTTGASTFLSNTLNIPQYQGQITLTTTGSSGAATLVGNTLNIPNYAGGGGASPATPTTLGTVYGNTGNGTSTFFASLGYNAVANGANSVAIGLDSLTNVAATNSVAVGTNTSVTGASAVAIGQGVVLDYDASVIVGENSGDTGTYAVVVGAGSVSGSRSITLGAGVFNNQVNSIAIVTGGSFTAPNAGVFIDSMRDESTGSPNKTLKYNTTTKELFYGTAGSAAATSTTLGTVYGNTGNGTSTFFASLGYGASAGGANSVAVGTNSSSGGADAVAVGRGSNAGGTSAVAVGKFTVSTNFETVAIGQQANATQSRATAIGAVSVAGAANATALGSGANASYANSIVITGTGNLVAANTGVFMDSMRAAASGSPTFTLQYDNTTKEIFYGAGSSVSPATPTVAGTVLGNTTSAGLTGLGYNVAITGANGTAIGTAANVSAANSVAIGNSAVAGTTGSIVISGSGGLTGSGAGVYIDSMRDSITASATQNILYNTSSKEFGYDASGVNFTPQTISANISVPTGYNGYLVGPITVANGYSITVADGANFVIVQ
jgi:hypothetical protein